MPIFSQTIQELASNKMPAPYYRFIENTITTAQSSQFPTGALPRSISAWINPTNHVSTDYANICGYGADTTSDLFVMVFRSTGNLGLWGSSDNYDSGIAVELNKWQHVVVTYDGTNIIGYVDGVQGTTTAKSYTTTESAFVIGSGPTGAYQNFEGSISEVRVYNFALSHTEVKELYSGASVPYKYKGAYQDFGGTWANHGGAYAYNTFTISGQNVTQAVGADDNYDAMSINLGRISSGDTYEIDYNCTLNSGVLPYFDIRDTASLGTTNSNSVALVENQNTATLNCDEGTGTGNLDAGYLTLWSNTGNATDFALANVTIRKLGAVAEYDGSGIASDKWFDKSGNDLHGTVTGATVENAPSGDDGLVYEEGTWTPAFTGGSSAGSYSMINTVARYTRIGRVVHVACSAFNVTELSAGSGAIRITGLPFTVESTASSRANVGTLELDNFTFAGSLSCTASAGNTYVEFRASATGTVDTVLQVGIETAADSDFAFNVTYTV